MDWANTTVLPSPSPFRMNFAFSLRTCNNCFVLREELYLPFKGQWILATLSVGARVVLAVVHMMPGCSVALEAISSGGGNQRVFTDCHCCGGVVPAKGGCQGWCNCKEETIGAPAQAPMINAGWCKIGVLLAFGRP